MMSNMKGVKTHFPFFRWIVRVLVGRWTRRICVAFLLFALCFTTAARLRSYFMTRRIEAVLRGLAELRVDRTTEDQLLKSVPYLERKDQDWQVPGVTQHRFYVGISNESDRFLPRILSFCPDWFIQLTYWLGYRYLGFDASVWTENGRVSRVSYGLARNWARPVQFSYIVSAKSVHGFWYPSGLELTSEDDESPQYRPTGNQHGLQVTYTYDAPADLIERAFRLDLSCFWNLTGCDDAREIAPAIWHDVEAIQASALDRLRRGKCPDSIIEGRMRYLPDLSVFLLEVAGSRRIEVKEEGGMAEEWLTDYQLKEKIRGHSSESWKNVRFRWKISAPGDPARTVATQVWPQPRIGSRVLYLGGLAFSSCWIIPATPSALELVHKIPAPPKRREDE